MIYAHTGLQGVKNILIPPGNGIKRHLTTAESRKKQSIALIYEHNHLLLTVRIIKPLGVLKAEWEEMN